MSKKSTWTKKELENSEKKIADKEIKDTVNEFEKREKEKLKKPKNK